MNWGTCSGSNNIHFDFPPIMADGRHYTAWQPASVVSQTIRDQAGIKSNWQYRKYMQDNADSIIKHNQLSSYQECTSERAGVHNEEKNNTPFLYKSCVDTSQPYGYETSDLKSLYLTKQQLQCRMYTPVMSQDVLLRAGYPNYN